MNISLASQLRVLISFLVLCFLSPIALIFIVPPVPTEASVETISDKRAGLPFRLYIPKLGIDASVEYVGITDKGILDAPKDPARVAWFKDGPRPGEVGNAVIDGHFGWIDDVPAVFDNLRLLVKGDRVSVYDEKGRETAFVVRELKIYGEYDDASEVFTSRDGQAHLNLITCEGLWDESTQKYAGRLVVSTDKE